MKKRGLDKDKREGSKEDVSLLKEWLGLEVGRLGQSAEKIFKRRVSNVGGDPILYEGAWLGYHFQGVY